MPSIVDQRHCSLLNPGRRSRFGGCWGKLVPGALSLPQPVKRQVNGTSHAWIVEWLLAGIDNHLVRAHGDTPGRNCAAGHARFEAETRSTFKADVKEHLADASPIAQALRQSAIRTLSALGDSPNVASVRDAPSHWRAA